MSLRCCKVFNRTHLSRRKTNSTNNHKDKNVRQRNTNWAHGPTSKKAEGLCFMIQSGVTKQHANVPFSRLNASPSPVSRWPTAYPDHTDVSEERRRSWRFSATHFLPHVEKKTTITTALHWQKRTIKTVLSLPYSGS